MLGHPATAQDHARPADHVIMRPVPYSSRMSTSDPALIRSSTSFVDQTLVHDLLAQRRRQTEAVLITTLWEVNEQTWQAQRRREAVPAEAVHIWPYQ